MQFRTLTSISLITLLAGLSTTSVQADHNSIWGPGTANMPNDIHNTRIEEGDTMTPLEWMDFVSNGDGAATVNRYLDDDSTMGSGYGNGGARRGGRR